MAGQSDLHELALLVHVKLKDPRASADFREFRELVLSAGATIVDSIIVSKRFLEPKFLIGHGKVEELKLIVNSENVDLVIFNHDLSPSQERNLEKELKCRVLDRKRLILDIFAKRAKTFEGKLQVELAQLEHLSTRLIRGWTHLERQKGGIGLRGPGEKQLEVDRRLIRNRIKTIKQRLEKVRKQRAQNRRARHKADVATVSLVGYTNAGKTTLFNILASEQQYAEDKLFATLDPHFRKISLRYVGNAILVDTVGFIRDLPHELIDAFKATLEETKDADLLLHVIDLSDELWFERKLQVEGVLHEIGALNRPILEVYNKIDLLEGVTPSLKKDPFGSILSVKISAFKNIGISELKEAIASRLCSDIIKGEVVLPIEFSKIRAKLYEFGAIDNEEIDGDTGNWRLKISIQNALWNSFCSEFKELQSFFRENDS